MRREEMIAGQDKDTDTTTSCKVQSSLRAMRQRLLSQRLEESKSSHLLFYAQNDIPLLMYSPRSQRHFEGSFRTFIRSAVIFRAMIQLELTFLK